MNIYNMNEFVTLFQQAMTISHHVVIDFAKVWHAIFPGIHCRSTLPSPLILQAFDSLDRYNDAFKIVLTLVTFNSLLYQNNNLAVAAVVTYFRQKSEMSKQLRCLTRASESFVQKGKNPRAKIKELAAGMIQTIFVDHPILSVINSMSPSDDIDNDVIKPRRYGVSLQNSDLVVLISQAVSVALLIGLDTKQEKTEEWTRQFRKLMPLACLVSLFVFKEWYT